MKTTLYSKKSLLACMFFLTSLFSLFAAPCEPAEPVAFPTNTWSVSVFSDNTFTNYAGYYTQANASGNGLTYLSTTAWASSLNPTVTATNSIPPNNITAYQGCTFANTDNFSFIYKRTFGLPAGVYKVAFKQTVGSGNSMQFLVNGTVVFTSTIAGPAANVYIPANAQLQVKSVAGVGASSAQLISIATTVPPALLPGSLVANKTICYNKNTGALSATLASGGCSGTKSYQWLSSTDGVSYTTIAGATTSAYSTNLTATTYFKRRVTDICLSVSETAPVKITVDASPAPFVAGTIGTTSSICSGSSALLTSSVPASGGYRDSTIAYQWYTNQSGSYVSISGATNSTYTTPVLTSTVSYRRYATSTAACGSFAGNSNTVTITTVTALPAPASITGIFVQCPGNTNVTYTASIVAGASSYIWTLPAGVTAVSGQTTRIITVDFNATYAGGTISAAAVNPCGTGAYANAALTVGTCDWVWTGAASTSWADAANWSPSSVPTTTSNVIIPNVSNKPIISTANRYVNSIEINPSSSLTITNGKILLINGNLTNNGTLTTVGTAKIQTAKTSGSQTFSGDLTGIKYLVKAAAGTLNLGNDWIVSGRIDLKQGAIDVNGHALTFDVVNGGYIGYTTGDAGTITGNVTVMKNLGQFTHNIATPLTGITAAQINDDFPILNPANGRSRLYNWNVATQGWATPGLPLSTPINRGAGYNFYATNSGVLDFTGPYTQTATPFVLSANAPSADAFILFGNPYLADLNWDNIGKSNISSTVYYWNQSAQAYATYTTGGAATNGGTIRVPVMQGFFVTSVSAGPASISIDPTAIYNGAPTPTFYRVAAPSDKFNFVVKDNTGKSDEAVIAISEDATLTFDGALDVYKMQNPATSLNIYTTLGTTDYAVNTIPTSATDQSLALNFVAPSSGIYTIEATDVSLSTTNVYLKDKVTGTVTPIAALPYTFTAESTDAPERFDVVFRTSATTSTQSAAAAAGIGFASFQKELVVLNQSLVINNATIIVSDLSGNIVKTISDASISGNATFNLASLPAGMYMIKLVDQVSGNSYSGKISIQ